MGAYPQAVLCGLIVLVVLFIFITPTHDLAETAMRAKQAADSFLLGLALLAATVVGLLSRGLQSGITILVKVADLRPRSFSSPEVSCTFRC